MPLRKHYRRSPNSHLQLVCNFGNMHISSTEPNRTPHPDADREKVSEANPSSPPEKLARNDNIHKRQGERHPPTSDIQTVFTFAGDNRIQIEAVAPDCTASNLRFYMMRVNFLFAEDGKIHDSTPLRQIDIPVLRTYSFRSGHVLTGIQPDHRENLPVLMKLIGGVKQIY